MTDENSIRLKNDINRSKCYTPCPLIIGGARVGIFGVGLTDGPGVMFGPGVGFKPGAGVGCPGR